MRLHRQRTTRRLSYVALVSISVLFLSSCSEDETAGANLVAPVVGPRVDESVLALDVVNGVPVGITSYFEQDEIVHLWVRWEKLDPPHEAEAVWYDPSAQEVAAAMVAIAGGPSSQITEFSLELTPSSATGRWEVVLFLDGGLQRSHAFDVFDAP